MARGKRLKLTREQVVQRALSQTVAMPAAPNGTPHPIGYRLEGGFNGGQDPEAPHCASPSYGDKVYTADCIGFVLWASGIDRMQPDYDGVNGVWLNCTSLLADARGKQKFCRFLKVGEVPEPGDWLLTEDHIGVIVRPEWMDISSGKPVKMPLLVIDCSPRHDKKRVDAINFGQAWSPKCVVVRPLFYAA